MPAFYRGYMKNILIRLIINSAALLVVVNIVSGSSITQWGTLIAAALVIAILNAIIKPILIILTLPINILTLGIFTLFINAFLMYLTSLLIKGFHLEDFWTAFWAGLIFSVVSIILNTIIGSNERRNSNNTYRQ